MLEAARALPRPLTVWSDSSYVVNCFDKAWWRKWQTNGWMNSQKQPVTNRDLWEPFVEVVRRCRLRWVKGHSGVEPQRGGGPARERRHAGRAVTAPLDLAATVVAPPRAGARFVVNAKWSAPCKACGDRYAKGASVTKNEGGLGARGVRTRLASSIGCGSGQRRWASRW